MVSDKPKLVFTDMAGKVTYESYLPSQQIKQAKLSPKEQVLQDYFKALYTVGESKL